MALPFYTMTPDHLEYILYELFAGRATPLQKKGVEAWLREPGNDEVYYRYVAKWEAEHGQYEPNTAAAQAAYEAFLTDGTPYPMQQLQPIAASSAGGRASFSLWRNPRWLWSVAASVALLLGVWATRFLWQYERYVVPYGQTRAVRLADGSAVTLNAHSTLRVPRFGFGRSDREVWLDGEAYFSVARTTDHRRFVVHTSRLDVRVLGTKFNVSTRRGKTEVVLSEGRVQLLTHPDAHRNAQSLLMKPGEAVALTAGDTALRRTAVSPGVRTSAWQQKRLVFDETPLSQVAQQIEDYYGVKVVLANHALASRELTGTLPNNDLGVVLRTLSVSYNLAVERQRDRIILR